MKNVIRKITTWMLVFGMTFTPVLTSIDLVTANAEEEPVTIVVGGQSMEFTPDNLNNTAKTAVSEAAAADKCADEAEEKANAAADVAADAKAAADVAQAAAAAADVAAEEAVNLQTAINDINNQQAQQAEGLVEAAEDAVGDANDAADAVTKAYKQARKAAKAANEAVTNLNSDIKEANTAIDTANAAVNAANEELAKKDDKYAALEAAVDAANDYKVNVKNKKIEKVQAKIDAAEAAYAQADSDAQEAIDGIKAVLDEKLINESEANKANNLVLLTQAQESIASGARTGAEEERDKAIAQKDAAVTNYKALNTLTNSETYDPVQAEDYVNKIVKAAGYADQNAKNAEAYAKEAEAAEAQAKLNYEAAEEALRVALAALTAVENDRKDAYDAADGVIDGLNAEDGAIADMNNKIDHYNELVKAAKKLLGDKDKGTGYQGWVTATNEQIAAANGLVETAQGKIDALDYSDANKKIKKAEKKAGKIDGLIETYNSKKGDAEQALNDANAAVGEDGALDEAYAAAKKTYDDNVAQKVAKALENFADTKVAYEEALENSTAAAALSGIASEKADEVADILSDATNQAALNAVINTDDAQNALKNALARDTNNGKTYQDLINDRNTAQTNLATAQGTLSNLQNNVYNAQFFATQNQIVSDEAATLATLESQKTPLETARDAAVKAFEDHYSGFDIWTPERIVEIGKGNRSGDHWAKVSDAEYRKALAAVNAKKALADKEAEISEHTQTKSNAEGAITYANKKLGEASDDVTAKSGILTAAQGKVDAVDNQAATFAYNDQNTLVVDLTDQQQYKDLMAALSKAYYDKNDKYSYKYLDANTSAYVYINNNQVIPAFITSLIPYTPGYNETTIENTYNLDHVINTNVNFIDWLFGDDTVSADEYNTAWLKNKTSAKCVIVCTDIDKLAVLRATYAQAQLAAAKSVAEQAEEDAEAAADAAADAAATEETALGTYESALSNLGSLQERLELEIRSYETKKIPDLKKIKELKTLLEAINTELAYADLTVPKKISESKKLAKAEKTEFVALGDTNMNPAQLVEQAKAQVSKAKEAWDNAKDHSEKAAEAAKAAREAADYAKSLITRAKKIADDYIEGEPEPESRGEGTTEGTAPSESAGPILIPLGSPSGVAGVRTGRGTGATVGTGEGTGEGTAPAANTVAKNNTSTLEETELPGAAEAPSTNLKDTDLPGAQGATDNDANLWWLWAAIAVLLALGFGTYKYVDNKKKAENTIQK